MPRDESSKKIKEKSIAEIEAEFQKVYTKVVRQTDDIKSLLKDKTKNSNIIDPNNQNLTPLESEYTLDEAQAEFFASIATLNSLIVSYRDGRLDSPTYHKQYKELSREILKFKHILERKGDV